MDNASSLKTYSFKGFFNGTRNFSIQVLTLQITFKNFLGPLGSVWVHYFTFTHTLGNVNVTPGLRFSPHLSMLFALVMSLRLKS